MGTEGWHLVARIDGKTGELQCFCGKRHPLPAGAGYKLCPPPQPVDLPRGELARIVEAHQQKQREAAEEMKQALLAQALGERKGPQTAAFVRQRRAAGED